MTAICPARLARALTLTVRPLDDGYRVTGGRQPHTVRSTEAGWTCDCPDSRYHRGPCKHRMATYLARMLDPLMWEALKRRAGP